MANEQKQKNYMSRFNTLECLSNFLHKKQKKIWIATVNHQIIAKNFNSFEITQIVTGKNANKSKFKASGQTGLRENKGKFAYRISNCKRTKLHQNSFNHS
jgi:hypothetical protein